MATKIVTKNSSTASAVPTASDLVQGELAVNVADKRLFTEDNGGSIVELGTNPSTLAVDTDTLYVDSTNNRVGVGTTSPASTFEIAKNDQTNGATLSITNSFNSSGWDAGDIIGSIDFRTDDTSTTQPIRGQIKLFEDSASGTTYANSNAMSFSTGRNDTLNERMRIDSSGNVGIGTSSPSTRLTVGAGSGSEEIRVDAGAGWADLRLHSDATNGGSIYFNDGADAGQIFYYHPDNSMRFHTNASERMRISSDGHLTVGTTSTDPAASGSETGVALKGGGFVSISRNDSAASVNINKIGYDGSLVDFRKGGSLVGSIGTVSGDIRIGGLDDNHASLRFAASSKAVLPVKNSDGDLSNNTTNLGASTAAFKDLHLAGNIVNGGDRFIYSYKGGTSGQVRSGIKLDGTNTIQQFYTAQAERMRIDSSGNLLVGTTSTSSSTTGFKWRNDLDRLLLVADGSTAAQFGRLTSDGDVVAFQKDGTTVGSIGTTLAGLTIGDSDTGLFFNGASDNILPFNLSTNATRDNAIDLGRATARFDDIYATNGTIQTSDRNEKQDIAELSDAEQRVAVACKGLLRKFRWKDSVAEKGDDARIHFGIIAQDLQAAFEAEGLDAGDYAMFISTTWTDEETNEEKTRMGVRYSELLAFIISAI